MVAFLAAAGEEVARDRGRAMVRALDVALRAIALDAVAPAAAPDAEAVREWCAAQVDETLMMKRLPVGPDEPPVPVADVAAVRAILDDLAGLERPRRMPAGRRSRARAARA